MNYTADHRLAIVVVNYASSDLVEANIARTAREDDLVVVVDNFTTSAEAARVKQLCERLRWEAVLVPVNAGFGEGVNLGVERAVEQGATELLIINPDASLPAAGVEKLHQAVIADPRALVGPLITTSAGQSWSSGTTDLRLVDGTMRSTRRRGPGDEVGRDVLPWLTGACLAASVDLWRRAGGFDPDYFLYWEDADLARRIVAAGGHLETATEVTAVHDEGQTHRKRERTRAKSTTYYRYNIRNRFVYAAKWLNHTDRARWVLRTPTAVRDVLLQGGRRQLLKPEPWEAAIRGVVGGVLRSRQVRRSSAARHTPHEVRVLPSFGRPRPTTNPYIVMLGDALDQTEGVDLLRFSWRRALFDDYDVVHFHWPEALFAARSSARGVAKRVAFAAWLVRITVRRTAVVRTVHNLKLPSGISIVDRLLLQAVNSMTTLRITINEATDLPPNQPSVLIPHGHYQNWYAQYPTCEPIDGRIAFVGLVRRYKGVPELLDAFEAIHRSDLSLEIAGSPSSDELADLVRSASREDPRITANLTYLDDAAYVAAITAAQLVVLPYEFMHNSGSVLAALSLGRPVLVPDDPANLALVDEIGPEWVMTYHRPLTPEHLDTARDAAAHLVAGEARPDLERRGWELTGAAHRRAYCLARAVMSR